MADIKFGTDGWRGIIAWDFTFENVHRLAQAMADYINEYSQNALAMKLLADMDNMYEQYKDSF